MRHFGHHLPHKIELNVGQSSTAVNECPPWAEHYDVADETDARLSYGREVFGIDFLDAIPLRSETGKVSGVAYVLPFASNTASRQMHRVYLKSMLLSETVEGLLPPWAFFVRCVVNAENLTPNAAREQFHDDSTLVQTRKELGQCLRDYLVQLAKQDRKRLEQIIHLHYLPFKSLALEDDEFFNLFIDWLPFETTLGTTTLEEHFRTESLLRYIRTVDEFRQVSSVAASQNICLFNAGYTYDTELLEKINHEFPDRHVESINADDLAQDFQSLTLDETEKAHDFVRLADGVLQQYQCSGEIRKFAPEHLPTLYTAGTSATFRRSVEQAMEENSDDMWGGILNTISGQTGGRSAQLVFNFQNALIQRLLETDDNELVVRSIELLYLQALMLGHYPLSSAERKLMETGLLGLVEHCLGSNR